MADEDFSIDTEPANLTGALQSPVQKESVVADEASNVTPIYLKGWSLIVVTIA